MLQGGSDGWVQLVYTAAIGGSLVAQEALREVVASGDGQRAAAFDWCMAHRTSELTTGAMEAVVMREMGPQSTGSFSSLFADLLRHEIVHGESDLARHLRPTGYEDWYRAACAAYRTDGLAGVESLGIDVSGGPVTAGNLSPQGPLGKYRELLSQHHRDAAMRASEEAAHQRGLGWFVACVDAYDIDPGIFKGVERTADADDVAQIMAASQLRANGEAGWWDRGLDVGRTTRLLVAASRVGIQVRPDLDRQLTRHLEHFRSLGVGGDGGQIDEALEQCVDHLRGRAGGVDATLLDRFLRLDPQGFAAAAVKEFVDIPLSRGRLRLLGIPTVVMIVLTFGLLLMIGGRYIGRDFAPRGLAPESSPAKVPEGVALALDSEGWQAWGRRWTRLVDLKDVDRLLGLTVLPERPKAGDQLVVDRRIARELKERMNWILRGRSAFGVKYEEEILEWPRLEMRLPRSSELNDGVFGIFEDRPWSEESMPERGVRRPVLLVLEVRQ